MDKDFLKEHNLDKALKRFNQLNEYTFIGSPMLGEDEEDDQQADMGNDSAPQDMNNQPNPQDTANQQGLPPQNPQDNQMTPPPPANDGGNNEPMPPSPDMDIQPEEDEVEIDVENNGEEEEVIDVDDLTQSQEAAEVKIDGVDNRLTKMLSIMNKLSAALDANNKKIEDLQQEFERRNPSEEEKLNIRSQASYPYSETPKDYWDNKVAQNPHYNVMYDNDVSTADEQKKFEITSDDVANINAKSVSDSFDPNKVKLSDFLNF